MGDPKKQRKKFAKPAHPWQKERILAEKEILRKYGLRRKKEVWKMNSILKTFAAQAKKLITGKTSQTEVERRQLLTRLNSLGLLDKNAKIEDALSLTLNNILDRRLQTIVFKKNMARTISQARQFIVHQHISVGDKKITFPSYLVPVEEEGILQFAVDSPLSKPEHSERLVKKADETKKIKRQTQPRQKKKAGKTKE